MKKDMVIVEIGGELLAWVNGAFYGHPMLLDGAKGLASYGDKNTITSFHIPLSSAGPDIVPSSHDAFGAAAALIGVNTRLASLLYGS